MIQRTYNGKIIEEYIIVGASASIFIQAHDYDETEKKWKPLYKIDDVTKTYVHNPITNVREPALSKIPFTLCERGHYRIPESVTAISYKIYEETPDWIKEGLKEIKKKPSYGILTRKEFEKEYHKNSFKLREKDAELEAVKTELEEVKSKARSKLDELEKQLELASKQTKK